MMVKRILYIHVIKVAVILFLAGYIAQFAYLHSLTTTGPMLHSLPDRGFTLFVSDGNKNQSPEMMNNTMFNQIEAGTVLNNTLEYMDWNDYAFMAKDAQRQGWGEQGAAFYKTLSAEEQELSKQLFKQYNFNAFASDHISLERSIGDVRTDVCKTKTFLKSLPRNSVSIVTIFHNEKNSTLLRSLHGFVNKSPAQLLREIVIVDDFSSSQELQEPLEKYVSLHFPKVRIIRNKQRQGLIRSRMIGANATSGDVLVFLDAHIEVNHNYLPPLIEPIVLDYRKIVCPWVDIIRDDTMAIQEAEFREYEIFTWDMRSTKLL